MKHQTSLRNELLRQHERIERHLRELGEAVEADDAQELQRVWAAFEAELFSHLETEERDLFPLVEPFHPEDIRALKVEHEQIRRLVCELGLCCDLHALNGTALAQLMQNLHRHAEYEGRTLYRWVEELAPIDTRRGLLRLLTKTVRADVSSAAPR